LANHRDILPDLTRVAAALSDPGRVRILAALFPGELCVCQILELIDLAPSTISKHLAILRDAGLIVGRKDGRWMYYRTADEPGPAAERALEWARTLLSRDDTVAEDARHLRGICRMDPEEITTLQRQRRCC
jgi:ArsR family transcriptional regulator, arsenate/arsenite/antimonite-responsive transcriptional repressor